MNVRAEKDAVQITRDVEVAEVFEDEHIEQAVVDPRVIENHERAAVKAPVADEHERSFFRPAVRLDHDLRRLAPGDLRGVDQITQRAEIAPEIARGFLDDLRVEADAAELHEVMAVGARQIDRARVAGGNDLPALRQIPGRQAEFGGEDVHRADGQNAECHARLADAVDDFVDRAVAACCDHRRESLRDPFGCKGTGLGRRSGLAHDRVGAKPRDLFVHRPGLFSAGGGIEDD